MNPEEIQRIRNAALKNFKYTPKPLNPYELLIEKAVHTTNEVRAFIRPILKAGGHSDKQALVEMVTRQYLERFSAYSKQELENLVTLLHVQIMMESIEMNPLGSDKPTLLG